MADPTMTDDLVSPRAGAATPEADLPDVKLPPELLKIPAMMALMTGKPGAASVNFKTDKSFPLAKKVFEHKDDLLRAGFGLYRALDGDTGVLFNQLYVHPDQVKQADTAGKILEIAPPLRDLNSKVETSGHEDHPILTHDGVVPTGMATAPVPDVPQATAAVPPAPAAAIRKALSAKIAGLAPGAPTTGAQPGAGRLVNSLQRPVV